MGIEFDNRVVLIDAAHGTVTVLRVRNAIAGAVYRHGTTVLDRLAPPTVPVSTTACTHVLEITPFSQ